MVVYAQQSRAGIPEEDSLIEEIVLPSREEMLGRLRRACDHVLVVDWLYPVFLEKAGQKMRVPCIVALVVVSIDLYLQGVPGISASDLYACVPQMVDALIPDPVAIVGARTFLAESLPL